MSTYPPIEKLPEVGHRPDTSKLAALSGTEQFPCQHALLGGNALRVSYLELAGG
jgi:hypothetical protein